MITKRDFVCVVVVAICCYVVDIIGVYMSEGKKVLFICDIILSGLKS